MFVIAGYFTSQVSPARSSLAKIARAFFLYDFLHLLVDHIFVARQIVPGAQNADRSGEAGASFHVRKQESVGGPRVMSIVNDQVGFRDAIAELHDFDVAIGLAADALVAILAEHEGLAVLQLNDVLAARFFFRQTGPRAIIENIAVLQNFDERGALDARPPPSACPSSAPGKCPRSAPQTWLPRQSPAKPD